MPLVYKKNTENHHELVNSSLLNRLLHGKPCSLTQQRTQGRHWDCKAKLLHSLTSMGHFKMWVGFLLSFIADTICVKSYFNLLGSKNVSGMGWRPVHDLATLQHGPLVPFVVVSDKTQASEKCNRLRRKKKRDSEEQTCLQWMQYYQ